MIQDDIPSARMGANALQLYGKFVFMQILCVERVNTFLIDRLLEAETLPGFVFQSHCLSMVYNYSKEI